MAHDGSAGLSLDGWLPDWISVGADQGVPRAFAPKLRAAILKTAIIHIREVVGLGMIFVFGNGLSIGFDLRLATAALTGRVVASLGGTYAGVLRDLAELGTPEDPDTVPVDVVWGGFEQLRR